MDERGGGATGVMSALDRPGTRSTPRGRREGLPQGQVPRSTRGRSTSRSASTRAAAAGFRPLSVASWASRRRMGSYRRSGSATSTTRSTSSHRSRAELATPPLLEAIAGDDWRDPQWVRGDHRRDYASAAGLGVEGMRIGVIEESVTSVDCDASVLDEFSDHARRCATRQPSSRFSLPIWAYGFATFQPFVAHLIANTIRSEGVGYGHLGYIDVDRLHTLRGSASNRVTQPQPLHQAAGCSRIASCTSGISTSASESSRTSGC